MQYVTKVQTADGRLHDNSKEATRHLDRIYGEKLSALSHGIVKTDWKYRAILEFIDANLPLFVELQGIKTDMELPRDEETEQ